ncbi:hypothetical protein Cylst_5468 [Cylindrospermum stagnale PCC 7417]|uniref:Uncharacterized protein n=1 Tax=Cylindrospermum stagnale PCC 7417 TaxID=56107 RepID=K9X498_9NOST|nr:hypothetical protein Cylst_5468 [Cylindrospermum stagnale PCC 7417]
MLAMNRLIAKINFYYLKPQINSDVEECSIKTSQTFVEQASRLFREGKMPHGMNLFDFVDYSRIFLWVSKKKIPPTPLRKGGLIFY